MERHSQIQSTPERPCPTQRCQNRRRCYGQWVHPTNSPLQTHAHLFQSIWLLDLSADIPPTTRLDGFDISLDQCPPSAWLPHNLNLHTWNVFDEPPPEFVGAFDVVHVRLVTVVIRDNDPRPLLSNLCKLLSEMPCPPCAP